MNATANIRIIEVDNYLVTLGLKRFIGSEFKIIKLEENESEYRKALDYLIKYVLDVKPVINDGQTISYHSWLLKFVYDDDFIKLYEVSRTGDGFIEGVDTSIKIIGDQRLVCTSNSSSPLYPLFSQMIVVSKGVLDGYNVKGVRYKSPAHMTGWWIITDLYDGVAKSLQTIHYHHLVFNRPDIIRYLALPFGYRIDLTNEVDIWFDAEAAK